MYGSTQYSHYLTTGNTINKHMKQVRYILSITLLLLAGSLNAQLTVNSTITTNQLLSALVSSGLTVSNVTLNCPTGSYASFSNGNTTNLGINSGIFLGTGLADSVPFPNTTSFDMGTCVNPNGNPFNDPDLIAIDPTAQNDVCILEFDILPKCDSLTIRFVFGSDEYPNYVNSINDIFGFFISGPNPAGGQYTGLNIATIPPNIPVGINTINNGNTNTGPCVNCAYYVDNSTGTTIEFNGLSTVITSSVWLVPCQSYHFKMAIADASDCIYDSGVFIDFIQCSSAFTYTTANTPDVCNTCNGTATVNVQGGVGPFTYQWLPSGGNGPTATGLCAGTYSVLVTDVVSCGIPDTAVITVQAQNSVSTTSTQTDASCNGDCNGTLSITALGTPPFTYAWTPNVSATNSATGLCAGAYTVAVTDSSGCSSTLNFTITQPTALTLALAGTNTICNGDTSVITATPGGGTGPYTVTWDNSLPAGLTQSVWPTTTTTYNATLTDLNGCSTTQAFTVNVSPAPQVSFTASPGDCAPATVTFTNTSTGATTYAWNFGDPASGSQNISVTQNGSHLYQTAGSYTVTLVAVSGAGCVDSFSFGPVIIFPQPVANVISNTATVNELSPQVTFTDLSTGGTNCVFYFGDGDSTTVCNFGNITHTYPAPGTYTAMQIVTYASGCSDTSYITIVVEQETSIYVPNAFTPNGSGGNNVFQAYGINVQQYELLVFDRWGLMLYSTKDIAEGWDGTYMGNLCQQDVYVWRINYIDSRGKKHKLIGSCTLLR